MQKFFFFPSQSWLGGPLENTVKILQCGCKRPPFLQHSLNLKQVQHLEIINVLNNFLWHAALFHMKELFWNTFSQSVLYLQLHSLPELLLLQVIVVLLQAQVKNKATDVFLPHSSLLKSYRESLCILTYEDWPSWSIHSCRWCQNMINCVLKLNLQISVSNRWLWSKSNNVLSSLIRRQICLISCKPQNNSFLLLKFLKAEG